MFTIKNLRICSKHSITNKLLKLSLLIIIAFIFIIPQPKVHAVTNSTASQSVDGQAVKILSVNKNNDVLIKGNSLKINVLSNTASNVQYKFLIYLDSEKTWTELCGGYSSPVPGNKAYKTSLTNLPTGKFKFAVLAKKSGTDGINSSSELGSYDDCYYFYENIIPKITINNSSNLSINDDVILNVDANIKGKVQYKVVTKIESSNEWVDKTNGYSSPTDASSPFNINIGKLNACGNYSIGLYIRNLSDNSSEAYSDYYCLSQYINESSTPIKVKDVQAYDLTSNDSPFVKILSDTNDKVQYRVFVNTPENNTYEDVSNGYSSPVNGNEYYTINMKKKFSCGKYKIYVCVKRAGTEGSVSNSSLGSYDDCYALETNILPKINVQNDSLNLKENEPLILNVTCPQLSKAQYKVFISSDSGINWTDATNGYTSAVDGSVPYKLIINPPFKSGKYMILVLVKSPNSDGIVIDTDNLGRYDNYYSLSLTVQGDSNSNIQYLKTNYDYTLHQVLDMEANDTPKIQSSSGNWGPANKDDVLKYLDPSDYINDDYGKYQFLRLTYCDGITADILNNKLKGKGVLENKGDVFLQAAAENNISPIYLVCHALEETDNGTSKLATGITVNNKTVYNIFGINAIDDNPVDKGSQRAYSEGWFSVDDAIKGGAKFVATSYINNPDYKQNTLYKMRWNPNTLWHQYATDVRWAFNEIYNLKSLYDLCPNANLIFDIPVFK